MVGVTWLGQKLRSSAVIEPTSSFRAGFVEFLQGLGNPALDEPALLLRTDWHIVCPVGRKDGRTASRTSTAIAEKCRMKGSGG